MEKTKARLPKALSPADLLKMNIPALELADEWSRVFGHPSRTGVWAIWGDTGSGKTSFCLELARELSKYGKVAYNSLEQGISLTMQQAMRRHRMNTIPKGRFLFISEDIDTLSARLSRKHSPDVVIVDSIQYTGLKVKDFRAFKRAHPNKLLIFVSQVKAGRPDGYLAEKVVYDADLKIFLQGYRAFSRGRTFGEDVNAYYTIWEEGAAKYWLNE